MAKTTRSNPKKTQIAVREDNKELYELYALWRSLPISILRTMSPDQLYSRMGIDDPMMLELSQIHTQGAFCEKYNIHASTLSEWNKLIRLRNPLHDAKMWAQTLAKNAVMAMYNHGIRKGNPMMLKLFFQVVNDWEESSKLNVPQGNVTFVFKEIDPKKVKEDREKIKNGSTTTDTTNG